MNRVQKEEPVLQFLRRGKACLLGILGCLLEGTGEDHLNANSSRCRSAQLTENRRAKCGCCLVKIHFTEGLPARICQAPIPTPLQIWKFDPSIGASADIGRAPISLHLRHILYMEILPEFGFQSPVPGHFLLHQRSLNYTQLAAYYFIHHYWFNIGHTWK